MKTFKKIALKTFMLLVKPLWGKGLGNFPPIRAIYWYLYRILVIQEDLVLQVHGYKMFVLASNYDAVSSKLLFGGGYEKYETILFQELVTEGMNVIDIGANIGYYTLLAAKLVGERGRVIAFEPEPQNYALLLRNIEVNGYKNVTAVRKAAFSKTGKVNLHLSKYSGSHNLYNPYTNSPGTVVVDTVSLDEFFEGKEHPIDIIKIDAEGAEMTVALGMNKIVKNNDDLKIFTEFYPVGLQSSGFSAQEYWDKLVEFGFKFIYLMNEEKQGLEPTDLASLMRFCKKTFFRYHNSANLLCSKSPMKGE
jgi:FkbM family methyltransferase